MEDDPNQDFISFPPTHTHTGGFTETINLTVTVAPDDRGRCLNMSSSADESSRNWLDLPRDVTAAILLRLGTIEVLNNAQRVCTLWRSICKEPSFWRTIDMRNLGDRRGINEDLEVMCRHAVDRSCGGLVEINIEYIGTDELLHHITASCTQIKRLRLVSCHNVSDEGLCETAAKLPLLEDLELSLCPFFENALEDMGRHCPRLKSLKLNCKGVRFPDMEVDEEALAIAKTMPDLRRLQLFGNMLTNVGLEAILDGCPHLEFLDLRQCFNVNLTGKLGKQCAERIKDFRQPSDSTHDYEFDATLLDDGSFDDDNPPWFSDIDIASDDGNHYEYDFSGSEYGYGGESDGYTSYDEYLRL